MTNTVKERDGWDSWLLYNAGITRTPLFSCRTLSFTTRHINTRWHCSVYNLMCWQVGQIRSCSRSSAPPSEGFAAVFFPSCKCWAGGTDARMDGWIQLLFCCWELLKESMERKTWWFWLCSAGYLWRGSIHPFVLCGQGRCGWEFREAKDQNEATTTPTIIMRTTSASGSQSTPECCQAHTHF